MKAPFKIGIPDPGLNRLALVHAEQAHSIGLTKEQRTPLVPVEHAPNLNGILAAATPQDIWLETPLEGHPRWVLASRIIGDDRGAPVVAEIRVFPKPTVQDRWRAPGEWSAEILGFRAHPIPIGGISPTLIRKAVARGARQHRTIARGTRFLRALDAARHPATPHLFGLTPQDIDAAGIKQLAIPQVIPRDEHGDPKRGRPVKWTAADFASIALTWDNAVRARTSPIKEVMRVHHVKMTQARNLVAGARARGFMHRASRQGARPEERLSEAARKALRKLIHPNRRRKP